ncbi:nicotinate-nucleotide--dimethylbenzimidazole phosphoribosyltransferase [Rubrobacter marinus]|uniref:Nicotinate-nucleotide--dimethylbenzimidazole phosphoribosyltransferase n=1 Tax=Rubrobacter marinus TaxID=2653852 RepID=A0A6G8PZJ5_9ACTN|nr:nicotinate-nucleotide--dimethylbenzimidazole phosphoribosyltransferase [Rubrobacter marinus]QIN79537.1 nicotinate-nucleotide--dimethylbenzimidazole phosphoribosyltransferase [Rubrobacter marinus]
MAFEDRVTELAGDVYPPDGGAAERARERSLALAKPPGSLGEIEDLGARLAAISGRVPPPVPEDPAVIVCAGDHGVLGRGVSPWPREVTAAMVRNFCGDGAAVNAIAKSVGARVSVLDVGVATELARHPRLRTARVRPGTDDLSLGPAMGREEAARALMSGAGMAEELVGSGVDLLVTGDMGIGNTTPAAALVSAFTGRPPEETTGRGTGIDDETLRLKRSVVEEALALHDPDPKDPLGVLAALGGLEHAAIAGVILAGAANGTPVVLDGVISNSAALVARALVPDSTGYLVAGHLSAEPGASVALEHLGLRPLLDLGLRLGEGTGGLLAVPLVRAAARVLGEMALLEDLELG